MALDDRGTSETPAENEVSAPRSLPIWAPLAVVATVPFVILRAKLAGVGDPDAFWHVLSGQHVWETRKVVVDDPFGTFSTLPWVQLDWASDLAMAGAYQAGGLAGVAFLFAVANILVFWAIYLACRQRAGVLVSGLAGVVGWIGTYASLGMRPQTGSFILLGLTLVAWHGVWAGAARPRWWLVPVTWVWACAHGLWFLGPLVGLVVVAGMALDRRPLRRLAGHAAVPVASIAAAAVTPIGPQLLGLPFTVNSYSGLVAEWRPPDIHQPYVAATVLLLMVTAVGWARSTSLPSWVDVLMWVMALGWALLYARTVAVGAVVAAPLAAAQLQRLLGRDRDPGPGRVERRALVGSTLVAVLLAAVMVPRVATAPVGMPDSLDASISGLKPGTVVLNDDAVGGWLLLQHPELRPVIDTRTYLFEVPYIRRYMAARTASGDYESFVRETGATAALLQRGDALAKALEARSGWEVVATDDRYILLRAPGA